MGESFRATSEEAVRLGIILAESKRREAYQIEQEIAALYVEIEKREQTRQQQR